MDTLLRYGTLIILVLQTTATVLLLRYSRTWPGRPYLPSTAVMLNECCKFSVCVFSLYAQRGFSIRRSWRAFRDEIIGKPLETFKLVVPSGLYCLQNNLLFIALTNLDAATYQVTYQLKILTTALFSVLLLKKQIQSLQWLALLILTIGVSLVQVSMTMRMRMRGLVKKATRLFWKRALLDMAPNKGPLTDAKCLSNFKHP